MYNIQLHLLDAILLIAAMYTSAILTINLYLN